MTLLQQAQSNKISPFLKSLAKREHLNVKELIAGISSGQIVVPLNCMHTIDKPCAVGKGLSTKVNANIGTSTDKRELEHELKKLKAAIDAGADTLMDLSVGGDLRFIRREIMKHCTIPIGTVPLYEIAVHASSNGTKDFLEFSADDMLEVLEALGKEGVDFFTIHSGVTQRSIAKLKQKPRVMGIVSRGGAIIASWMQLHKKENPFFEYFDKILDIAQTYDVTLSLGDGLRPGSIFDATDPGQIEELKILGALAKRARAAGVQVMIEGPGHVPLPQIKENILLQKKYCDNAPFYILGPLVTDVAAGYDHITSAIGGALAASYGADFLCYVTASEHLRHPSIQDVKEGVIASRIAAHAADIAKGLPQALVWDKEMSIARRKRDWKKQIALSIDPVKAAEYRKSSQPNVSDVCTMCGNFCSMKLMERCSKK